MTDGPQTRDLHVVRRYLIYSVVSGMAMGVAFPFFARLFVVVKPGMSPAFLFACIAAGLVVGGLSFLIGFVTILRAVTLVSGKIDDINANQSNLSEPLRLRSSDGVGKLVDNFNAFRHRIRKLLVSLAAIAERTRNIGFQLAANSTETSAASEEISRHMDMIHRQAETLSQEIENVDAARLRINDAAVAVSENIDRQSGALTALSGLIERQVDGAKSVAETTKEKTRSVEETILLSRAGIEQIGKVAENIEDINEGLSAIGQSLVSIDDISERIGVLGINASIEAAHAGLTGSGFAVVAAEIRKLAETAGRNSHDIRGRVAFLVGKVRKGVELSVGTRRSQRLALGEHFQGGQRHPGHVQGPPASFRRGNLHAVRAQRPREDDHRRDAIDDRDEGQFKLDRDVDERSHGYGGGSQERD